MKVVFFGSSRYAVPVLETLHNNFDLPLVITTEQNNADPIPFISKAKKIEYLTVRKPTDLLSRYEMGQALASVGVVADFGIIIPQKTLDYFPQGIINIHPSLLPKYRGPSPVQNAILNGDRKTGVTIIKLDKYMDHGPVLAQVEEEIRSNDTSKTLYERLFKIGAELLVKVLTRLENENIHPIPQNHDSATFTKELTKDDGYVDFKTMFSSKDFFERMVRAYYPWPGAWTKAKTGDEKDAKIIKFLPDKKIQVEGKTEMTYKDFLNGYKNADTELVNFLKKDI
jgi:methionyl-tRNA formyltransferase